MPDHYPLPAVDPAKLGFAARPLQHLEYLVWGWDQPMRLTVRMIRGARSGRRSPARLTRPFLVDGTGYADRKAQALACYPSQFSPGASLYGRSIGGVGPLDNDFLRRFGEGELFLPRALGRWPDRVP